MLKQWLSLLLSKFYSKKEAALVAHQAMPSGSVITLVDNGTIGPDWTGSAFSGIAPEDGYLTFSGTSTTDVPIVGMGASSVLVSLTYPWTGARLSASLPIAKGAAWNVQGSSMKDVVITFISCIGGDKCFIQLVRRASICLSPSFNCLQKRFLRVRNPGLATSPCQRQKTLSFINLRESNGFILLRQVMVICMSWREIPSVSTLRLGQSHPSLLRTLTLWQKFSFPQRKARSSLTSFTAVLQQMKQRLLLSTPSVQLNKNLGGATC